MRLTARRVGLPASRAARSDASEQICCLSSLALYLKYTKSLSNIASIRPKASGAFFLTTSAGDKVENPHFYRRDEADLKRVQQLKDAAFDRRNRPCEHDGKPCSFWSFCSRAC